MGSWTVDSSAGCYEIRRLVDGLVFDLDIGDSRAACDLTEAGKKAVEAFARALRANRRTAKD